VKRRLLITLAIVGLLAAIPLSRAGAAAQTTSNVTLMSDGSVVDGGTSTLTRTESGISFSLETSGLEPGHAVTIWWMVVNPDGGVAVLYAAGHVIDEDGTAEFGGYLQVGDSTGALPVGTMVTDTSLEDALSSTVYLVVRDHGPAKPGLVNQQIHTFGVCNPEGVEHCTDLQISEHQPS
jgi:Cu/Zn superoxide dismutase